MCIYEKKMSALTIPFISKTVWKMSSYVHLNFIKCFVRILDPNTRILKINRYLSGRWVII